MTLHQDNFMKPEDFEDFSEPDNFDAGLNFDTVDNDNAEEFYQPSKICSYYKTMRECRHSEKDFI